MEDLKKKINFDPALLYYSTTNKTEEEDVKNPVTNTETYNSTNRKYICTLCGKAFFTNSSLNVHMENHTPDEQIHIKDKDDSWKDRLMLNKGISCSNAECNFVALDAVEYQKHHTSCDGKRVLKDGNYAFCEQCDHYFSSEDHLKAHSLLAHQENCSDISLQEDKSKQTVSDPVCLFVSENENGAKKNSPSKYPDSSVTKKRIKKLETENPSSENSKKDASESNDQLGVNAKLESSSNLNTNADICNQVEESAAVVTNNPNPNEMDDCTVEDGNEKILVGENEVPSSSVVMPDTSSALPQGSEPSKTSTNITSVVEDTDVNSGVTLPNIEISQTDENSTSVDNYSCNEVNKVIDSCRVTEKRDSDLEISIENSESTINSNEEKSESKPSVPSDCILPIVLSKTEDQNKSSLLENDEKSASVISSELDESAVSTCDKPPAPSELVVEQSHSVKSAEVSVPGQSVKLSESTSSAEQSESGKYTESSKSTKSAESVHSSTPCESEKSVNPTDSRKSFEQSESEKSVQSDSVVLVDQSESVKLVEVFESVKSVNKSEFKKSAESNEPVKPAELSESEKLVKSTESAELAKLTESTKPAEPYELGSGKSAKSSENAESSKLCQSARLAEKSELGESAKSSESSKLLDPCEPMESTMPIESKEVVQLSKSEKSAGHSEFEETVEFSECLRSVKPSESSKSLVKSVASPESRKPAKQSELEKLTESSELTTSAKSTDSQKSAQSSESSKSSIISASASSSESEQSAVSSDVKSVEEKYNGIEEMMYEMFKESDIPSEIDATSNSLTHKEITTAEYDIKKELLSPPKSSENIAKESRDTKSEKRTNPSIVDELSDFKYERHSIKKKYLKSYSREDQIKKNLDNKSSTIQDNLKKEAVNDSVSAPKSKKKSITVPNISKESKSKHERSLTSADESSKGDVISSPKRKSTSLQSIPKENKSRKDGDNKEEVTTSPKKKPTTHQNIVEGNKSNKGESNKAELTSSPKKKSAALQNVTVKSKSKREGASNEIETMFTPKSKSVNPSNVENKYKREGDNNNKAELLSSLKKKSIIPQNVTDGNKSMKESESNRTDSTVSPKKKSSAPQNVSKEAKSKQESSSTSAVDRDEAEVSSSAKKKFSTVQNDLSRAKSKQESSPISESESKSDSLVSAEKGSNEAHIKSSIKKKSTAVQNTPKESKSKIENVSALKNESSKLLPQSDLTRNISKENKSKQEGSSTPKKDSHKDLPESDLKKKLGTIQSAFEQDSKEDISITKTHVMKDNVKLSTSQKSPTINSSSKKDTSVADDEKQEVDDKKSVDKNISTPSVDLNVRERSVRTRKKLILPDFEYGFDMKVDSDDFLNLPLAKRSTTRTFETSTPSSAKKITEGGTARKRGRPRKSVVLEDSSAELRDVDASSAKKPKLITENEKESTAEESEEFALSTAVLESEIDTSDCNVKNKESSSQRPDEDSWLNKIDFSEQSVLDSWQEEPKKKKRGRPRKNEVEEQKTRNVEEPSEDEGLEDISPKTELVSQIATPLKDSLPAEKKKRGRPPKVNRENKNILPSAVKKKRGRPLKINPDDDTIVEISVTSEESEDEATQSSEPSISQSPKPKRGRPPKVKEEPREDSPSKLSDLENSSITEASSDSKPVTESVESASPVLASPPKKRGRPRKSLENTHSSPEKAKLKEGDVPDTSKDKDTDEPDDLKRRREFMQYIRIKDETDDPDYEPKQKHVAGSSVSDSSQKKSSRLSNKVPTSNLNTYSDRPYSIYNKYEAHAQSLLKRKKDPVRILRLKTSESRENIENRLSKEGVAENEQVSDVEKKDGSENEEMPPETTAESKEDSSNSNSLLKTSESNETAVGVNVPEKTEKPAKERIKKQTREKVKIPTLEKSDEKDETKNIDPDLYLTDIRNKSKYSKIFRKVTEIPKHDEYFPDSLVTCGRCKKLMTLRHYHMNHKISHYFVTWLEGEKEIDLSQDSEVTRVMQQAVNPDAIRKKCIRLACEKCDKTMKSVVGYVSHVRFCQKMDETEFLGTCVLCGKRLKPSSLRHHYVKFHGISQPNVDATSKDDLILDTAVDTSSKSSSSAPIKVERKNYLKGFERTAIKKSDVLEDEQFWTSLKTSYGLYMCMGLSCRHMTLSKDDLKTHIASCCALFCDFRCVSCPYKTKYESEIIYHSKNFCKDSSDTEEKLEDKVMADGRRTSTRVKKRSFRFDDYSSDEERKESRKKRKHDADFVPSEEDQEADELEFQMDTDDDITEKKSRFNKRKSDTSSVVPSEEFGLRQAFLYHNSTRSYDPLNWAVEIRLKTFSACSVHENLKVDINEWETFPVSDLPKHSPEQSISMKIAQDNDSYTEYKLFQSDLVKGVPVCYTGGPVWAMSWVPLPAHVTEQYLAVAGLKHMNHVVEINSSVDFPSLVQIWKYSSLDNISNDIHKPVLAWAIAHKYGAVWCMEWCPSGGFDNSSDPCRLGILALATSSGCVVVYSVPKLDSGGEARNIVANPEPDLILKVKSDNVQCTKIVWQRNLLFNTICGGFTDGMIALWNISTTSSLLKKGKEIYPFRMFEAHSSAITALDLHWIDSGRFMLTSSIDRTIRYWDLDDLSGPLYEVERSTPALNVAWMHHWIVAANAHDYCSSNEANAFLSHPRDMERKKSFSTIRDTFWSVAYSDWNDMVAISSNGGQVSVFAAKHLSTLSFKQPDFDKVVTQTIVIPLSDEDKRNSESTEGGADLPETKNSFDCTSIIKNNGLKFCDRVKNKSSSEKMNFAPDQGSVSSINKICWNQNYNSFNWLAVGYECGIVRVIRVERFDKHHLTKFYKMNENNCVALL